MILSSDRTTLYQLQTMIIQCKSERSGLLQVFVACSLLPD